MTAEEPDDSHRASRSRRAAISRRADRERQAPRVRLGARPVRGPGAERQRLRRPPASQRHVDLDSAPTGSLLRRRGLQAPRRVPSRRGARGQGRLGGGLPPYELEAGDGGLLPCASRCRGRRVAGGGAHGGGPGAPATCSRWATITGSCSWDYRSRDLPHTKAHAAQCGIVCDDAGNTATCGDDGTAHPRRAERPAGARLPRHEGFGHSIAPSRQGLPSRPGGRRAGALWDASRTPARAPPTSTWDPARARFPAGRPSVVPAGDDATIEVWDVTEELRAQALTKGGRPFACLYGHARGRQWRP